VSGRAKRRNHAVCARITKARRLLARKPSSAICTTAHFMSAVALSPRDGRTRRSRPCTLGRDGNPLTVSRAAALSGLLFTASLSCSARSATTRTSQHRCRRDVPQRARIGPHHRARRRLPRWRARPNCVGSALRWTMRLGAGVSIQNGPRSLAISFLPSAPAVRFVVTTDLAFVPQCELHSVLSSWPGQSTRGPAK
jgi:hypothetical protein